MTDPYELLTRGEAALHLRCTVQYITDLTQSNRLHSVRVGKRVLIPRASLEAFIRGEQVTEVTDGRWPPTVSLFDAEQGDEPEPAA